ncbi:hypothetical protein ABEF95_004520 [Exophiala dermatitidis]
MFHTFETAQYTTPEQADTQAGAGAKRRTSTVRACEPCRRRKIRCNGEHPCETCQWYRKAASCHYTEPRQRQLPSRRSVEKISQTLQEYRGILQRLFPNTHPDQLRHLSREKLVELISNSGDFQPPSPKSPSLDEKAPSVDPDARLLERFQPMPEETDDALAQMPASVKGVTDAVKMLSLHVKQRTSFLGISSTLAALRVITWLDPECLSERPEGSTESRALDSTPTGGAVQTVDTSHQDEATPTAWDELPLVDAYFTYVQPFAPLLEERTFRDTYTAGHRNDAAWLLLLNSVLAMGCMAAGVSQDTARTYFARAQQSLTLDMLDTPNLEIIQALAIMGGLYLNYAERKNQANALMGVTMRLATSLGLHRDYNESVCSEKAQSAASAIEMKRRIWWTVFVLDASGGYMVGRPSLGRMSAANTAKLPQESIGLSSSLLTLTQERIRFAMLSTRVEDALAISPLLDEHERHAFDALFLEWYNHSSVQNSSAWQDGNEAPGVTVLKNVMRWRYLHLRIILQRPVLLWYAIRKMSPDKLSQEKKAAVELCRELCADLIHDIAATWKGQGPNAMAAWLGTCLLYQTVMVPLLSLYSDPTEASVVESSRQQVTSSLQTLQDMQAWVPIAKRAHAVVSRLYESSKRRVLKAKQPRGVSSSVKKSAKSVPNMTCPPQQPSSTTAGSGYRPTYIDVSYANAYGDPRLVHTTGQEMFIDNMFDSIKWSNSRDSPLGVTGPQTMPGWDYDTVQTWAGMPQAEDYFDVGFGDQTAGHLAFDMGMQNPSCGNHNHLNPHYGVIERRHGSR